jgi:hypothetical protein
MPLRFFALTSLLLMFAAAPAVAQCTVAGETGDSGAGCETAGAPVLTVIAALNQIVITVTSPDPSTLGALGAATGCGMPLEKLGCFIYLNPSTEIFETFFFTDAQGNFTISGSLANDPTLVGVTISIQAALWVDGADVWSNAVCLSFVCATAGGSGCTPGYWKQTQHFANWPPQFTPNQLFSSVFNDAFPGMTLVQVLSQGGGGLNALGRHTVAALLDTARLGPIYGTVTTADVIAMFNSVFPGPDTQYETLKNYFESLNAQGCPLN